MNFKESECLISSIRHFYLTKIESAIERAGGQRELARKLDRNETLINNTIKRNSFSALRRLVKLIIEKEI